MRHPLACRVDLSAFSVSRRCLGCAESMVAENLQPALAAPALSQYQYCMFTKQIQNAGALASLMAICCVSQFAGCQQLTWLTVSPPSSPPARYGHHLIYDSHRQKVVLHGGVDPSGLHDTWEWDGANWALRTFAVSPPGDQNGCMAYDATRGVAVYYTGFGLYQTWEYDGLAWARRFPVSLPPNRSSSAMAYDDSRQRIVMFGGIEAGLLGDTWEWDGTNWSNVTPQSSPVPRADHAMCYDARRQRIVLFGGYSNTGGTIDLGDTWEWDGAQWLPQFATPSPPASSGHAMAYDVARGVVVLSGGGCGNRTWIRNGVNWSNPALLSGLPCLRYHATCYDGASNRVMVFGGYGPANNLTRVLVNGVAASGVAFGAPCGSPALSLVPDAALRPVLGSSAAAAVTGSAYPLTAMALGFSNQFYGAFPLPVTLASVGMPGCALYQSSEYMGLPVNGVPGSNQVFAIAIPNSSFFLGVHVYLQAYALAPGQNQLGVISSNGVDWLLGNT